jgi:glycosyltransferase involved in cell wall biosynthesis
MRIAYLSTFYPYRGGIAQYNAMLYRELEKRHEIKAYTFTRQYPHIFFPGDTQYVTESDKIDLIQAERILDSINPISYLKTAKEIRHFQPHLLIIRLWMPFFSPSLATVAKKVQKIGTKTICIADNVIPHERRFGDLSLLRYLLKRVDGFIILSKIVEQQLLSLKPNVKCVLIPHPIYEHFGNPIDIEKARKQLDLPLDKKIILFFGFIRDYKGLDILLRSMKHLNNEYLLLVAGEVYGSFEKYQVTIEELRIEDKIKLCIEYINDQDVASFFSAADVCVLPYRSATQSGIVQIAYNFNLPVICTNVGGLSEMVSDGVTGFVLDSQKPEDVAGKINHYFENNLKSKFSQNINQTKMVYSWQNFAGKLISFYDEL